MLTEVRYTLVCRTGLALWQVCEVKGSDKAPGVSGTCGVQFQRSSCEECAVFIARITMDVSRALTVALILFCSFNVGIQDGQIGVTLPDLEILSSASTTQVSAIYTWRAVPSILGSILIGHLLDYFNRMLTMGLVLIACGIFTSLIAVWPNILVIWLLNALSAFFASGAITAVSMLPFHINPSKPGPLVQAVRLLFTVGMAASPFIFSAFLARPTTPLPETADQRDHFFNYTRQDMTTNSTATMVQDIPITRVVYVYYLTGISNVISGALCVLQYTVKRTQTKSERSGTVKDTAAVVYKSSGVFSIRDFVSITLSQKKKIGFLSACVCLVAVYAGLDISIGGLLVTFMQQKLGWSVNASLLISAVYQLVKVVASVIGVGLAALLRPRTMLVGNVLLLACGTTMLYFCYRVSNVMIWVSVIITACGSASMYPTTLSFVQECTIISGKISSLLNVGFNIGMMSLPTIGGSLIDSQGPSIFLLCLTIAALLCVVLLLCGTVVKRNMTMKQPALDVRQVSETTPLTFEGSAKHY